eukprot:7378464-Prymnesium_polylepis.1
MPTRAAARARSDGESSLGPTRWWSRCSFRWAWSSCTCASGRFRLLIGDGWLLLSWGRGDRDTMVTRLHRSELLAQIEEAVGRA